MADEKNIPSELEEAVIAEMCENNPDFTLRLFKDLSKVMMHIQKEEVDPEMAALLADPDKVVELLENCDEATNEKFTELVVGCVAYWAACRMKVDPEYKAMFDKVRKTLVDARPEQDDPSQW